MDRNRPWSWLKNGFNSKKKKNTNTAFFQFFCHLTKLSMHHLWQFKNKSLMNSQWIMSWQLTEVNAKILVEHLIYCDIHISLWLVIYWRERVICLSLSPRVYIYFPLRWRAPAKKILIYNVYQDIRSGSWSFLQRIGIPTLILTEQWF